MSAQTLLQFDTVLSECRAVFAAKTLDYGTSWRVFRMPSLTDQMYIKACRIRNLEQNEVRRVDEGIRPELVGLINYALMSLIQMELGEAGEEALPLEEALRLYDRHAGLNRILLSDKNHDYGEAWREMRRSSLTDMILVKLLRIKQIEDNHGLAKVSEGVEGGYRDILNYAAFALIRMNEEEPSPEHLLEKP
jgi:hypothetical protein